MVARLRLGLCCWCSWISCLVYVFLLPKYALQDNDLFQVVLQGEAGGKSNNVNGFCVEKCFNEYLQTIISCDVVIKGLCISNRKSFGLFLRFWTDQESNPGNLSMDSLYSRERFYCA